MDRRLHLEIWNPAYNERVAIVTRLHAASTRRVLRGEETLDVTFSLEEPAAAAVAGGCVLDLTDDVTGEHTAWRLITPRKVQTNDDDRTISLQARALWNDLIEGMVHQDQLAGSPKLYEFGLSDISVADILADYIVPGYEGASPGAGVTFAAGNIEAGVDTRLVSLTFDRTTPLTALRLLEEAGDCEAQFRLDGSIYHIDLFNRVGRSSGVEIRYQKNLRSVERIEDATDVATRVRSWGLGLLTLADAQWTLREVPGQPQRWEFLSDIPLVVPFVPHSSSNPIFEDNAFVGMWFIVPRTSTSYEITASNAAGGYIELDLSGLPALVDGDIGYFSDDALSPIDYLESPSGVTEYGVRLAPPLDVEIPDAANIVPDPQLDEWTAGAPHHWFPLPDSTPTDPTITQETDRLYVRHGSFGARVVATAADQGIFSVEAELPSDPRRPYTGFRVGLTVISGRVKIELHHSNTIIYPVNTPAEPPATDAYQEISLLADDEPLPAGSAHLVIKAFGGPAEFVLDYVMITAQVGDEVPNYVNGAGAEHLWDATASALLAAGQPKLQISAPFADLHRIDPTRYRFDEIRIGDTVRVVSRLGDEDVRLVELFRDELHAEATDGMLAPDLEYRIPALRNQLSPGVFASTRSSGAPAAALPSALLATPSRFMAATVGAPTFTTLSPGVRVAIWPHDVSATDAGHSIGVEAGALWYGVGSAAHSHKWYAGETHIATLAGTGAFTARAVQGIGTDPAAIPMYVKGAPSQTAALIRVNYSDDTEVATLSAAGGWTAKAQRAVGSDPSVIPLYVQGAAAQSAALIRVNDSGLTQLAALAPDGAWTARALKGIPTDVNAIPLYVEGAAGQVSNLIRVNDNSLAQLFGVTAAGRVDIGPATALAFGNILRGRVNSAAAANTYLSHLEFHQTAASDGFTMAAISASGISEHASGHVTTIGAMQAVAQHTGAGTVGNLRAIDARAVGNGAGLVDNVVGVHVNEPGTDNCTNAFAFYAQDVSKGVNRYGLYLEDVSGGAGVNYAIYTNAGAVRFGGAATFDGAVTFNAAFTFAGDLVVGTIRRGTTDGADNSRLLLAGGGAVSADRGAYIKIHGNEFGFGEDGFIDLQPGTAVGALVRVSGPFSVTGTFTVAGLTSSTGGFGVIRTAGNIAFGCAVTGDSANRFHALVEGTLQWGPGNAAQDTNLYRSAANSLRTDGNFAASGAITAFGSAAALFFDDRDTPAQSWAWYSDASVAYLWNNDGGGEHVFGVPYGAGYLRMEHTSLAAPTFTTISSGARIVLWPHDLGAANATHAIGVNSGTMWYGVGATSHSHVWYGGTTVWMELVAGTLILGADPGGTQKLRVAGPIRANEGNFYASDTAAVTLFAQGIASQTGALVRINDSTTAAMMTLTAAGALSIAAGMTATSFSGSGASLTNLNASSFASGNVPYARMPSGSGSWDVGVGNTLTLTRTVVIGTDPGGTDALRVGGAIAADAGKFQTGATTAIRLFAQAVSGQTAAIFRVNDDAAGGIFRILADRQVVFDNLPTSSAGLTAGSVWNNGGVMNIA